MHAANQTFKGVLQKEEINKRFEILSIIMGKAQTITLHFHRNTLTVSVTQQDSSITTQLSAKYISLVSAKSEF